MSWGCPCGSRGRCPLNVDLYESGDDLMIRLADVVAVQCAKFMHIDGGRTPSCLVFLREGSPVVLDMLLSRSMIGAVRAHYGVLSVFESLGTIVALADVSFVKRENGSSGRYGIALAGARFQIFVDEDGAAMMAQLRAYHASRGGLAMSPGSGPGGGT